MSDKDKKPETTCSCAASAEDLPAAIEPSSVVPEATAEPVNGIAKVAASSSVTADFPVADDRELQAWIQQVRGLMRQKSRRSFLGMGVGIAAGFEVFRWLTSRREIDAVPWPFRNTLELNEQLARDYFKTGILSPAFDPSQVSADQVNGYIGLEEDIDVAAWKLEIQGLASQDTPLTLGLDAIKDLPRIQMTTEFKCIEGWSVVVTWAGARFADFMKAYPPPTRSGYGLSLDRPEDLPPYVSVRTPGGAYCVGLDMESILHPQTLLCYERNGAPLSQEHGPPLRLVIPVKYGVKNIKRIGTIRYSTLRPADYWAEQGYDWYVGL